MKKFLGIVVLGLLLSGNAYADKIKKTLYPQSLLVSSVYQKILILKIQKPLRLQK